MAYPIRAKDFDKGFASNDEEAMFIAVEAILNGDFEQLPFSKNIDITQLKIAITNDVKFEEVRGVIGYEKNILTSIIANNEPHSDITKLMDLQNKTLDEFTNTRSIPKHSKMSKFSVAASFIAIITFSVLGLSYVINNQSTATKSYNSSLKINKTKSDMSEVNSTLNSDAVNTETSLSSVPSVVSRDESNTTAPNGDTSVVSSSPELDNTNTTTPDTTSPETSTDSGGGVSYYGSSSSSKSNASESKSFIEKHKNLLINIFIVILIFLILLFFKFAFSKSKKNNN